MLKQLILLCFLRQIFSDNEYCNFPCGKEHTVCKRESCGLSPECGTEAASLPLDDADREYVLDMHNTVRNKLALGNDTTGGNGEASNMNILRYDKDLEYVAQCWSNACTGPRQQELCRDTKKFSPAGQNMYFSGISNPDDIRDKNYIKKAVEQWYSQISDSNAGEIDSFKGTSGKIGYFTQLVWANTTHVGCGRTYFVDPNNGFRGLYIYCNYGVGGNTLGSAVYKRGPPCSTCPDSCSKTYPGLCYPKEEKTDNNADGGKTTEPGAASEIRVSFYTIVAMFILSIILWN